MKQLQQILKHFTVRVGEDMKVLSKPDPLSTATEFITLSPKDVSEAHKIREKQYNNALELVQMPRVMEFVEYYRKMIEGTEREYFEKRNCEAFIYSCEYMNFAKQTPTLSMYVPTDENGKPMEEPMKYDYYLEGIALHAPLSIEDNIWTEQCKAYETALSKTLFYGWSYEETKLNGTVIIQNKDGHVIGFGKEVLLAKQGVPPLIELVDLDKAFGEIPHFVKLDKLDN